MRSWRWVVAIAAAIGAVIVYRRLIPDREEVASGSETGDRAEAA